MKALLLSTVGVVALAAAASAQVPSTAPLVLGAAALSATGGALIGQTAGLPGGQGGQGRFIIERGIGSPNGGILDGPPPAPPINTPNISGPIVAKPFPPNPLPH